MRHLKLYEYFRDDYIKMLMATLREFFKQIADKYDGYEMNIDENSVALVYDFEHNFIMLRNDGYFFNSWQEYYSDKLFIIDNVYKFLIMRFEQDIGLKSHYEKQLDDYQYYISLNDFDDFNKVNNFEINMEDFETFIEGKKFGL